MLDEDNDHAESAEPAMVVTSLVTRLLWHTVDDASNATSEQAFDDTQSMSGATPTSAFDPRVFWSVNAFLAVMILGLCGWCYCRQTGRKVCCIRTATTSTGNNGNVAFPTHAEYRMRQQQDAVKLYADSPEKRKRRVLSSFRRNGVTKVVTEKDLIVDGDKEARDDDDDDDDAAAAAANNDEPNCDDCAVEASAAASHAHDMEEGNATPAVENPLDDDLNDFDVDDDCNGFLRLTKKRKVPNCCAICLMPYAVGERVVWSCNPNCRHAFHMTCCMEYLIAIRKQTDAETGSLHTTPCPCCRQEFTDIASFRKEQKITWRAGSAFDPQTIRFFR